MILLDRKEFNKIIEPLKLVSMNNLFARSVVEKKVSGKVFVDNADNPKTYYVIHPYGMTLLFGNWTNLKFNNKFRDYALNTYHIRDQYEWMQVFPNEWNDTLSDLFGNTLVKSENNTKETGIIELNTRVNFKFVYEKYAKISKKKLPYVEIVRTDEKIFDNMQGSVVPKYFWDSKEDFLKNGIGFSLLYNSQLASTAYSSYFHDDKLEMGIETVEKYRKMGFAEIVCCALIDYCIENEYEPVWSCRLENAGSYKLAQKLGFEPALQTPYYRLSK